MAYYRGNQVKIAHAATLAANNFVINRRFTLQRAAMQKVVSWQLIVCAPYLPNQCHSANPENAPLGANITQGVDNLWD
jgi:hypothetical protein